MDLLVKFLLSLLIAMPLFHSGHTRALPETMVANRTNVEEKANATDQMTLEKLEEEAKPDATPIIKHIRREHRAVSMQVVMPFDLHTLHMPCDYKNRLALFEGYMPNHCIWALNNRHAHVEFYRVFKTYQLESFFFSQYYERLKRYEIDTHEFTID